ncbi:MAG: IS1096 element passenger TnpR family protein [Pirellulaceae bacterium]
MARSKKTGTVYQLKTVLADVRPPIWRRFQVQDCNLTKLHEIIQRAMGWYGGHLWAFEIDGEQYGDDPGGA